MLNINRSKMSQIIEKFLNIPIIMAMLILHYINKYTFQHWSNTHVVYSVPRTNPRAKHWPDQKEVICPGIRPDLNNDTGFPTGNQFLVQNTKMPAIHFEGRLVKAFINNKKDA